MHIKKPDVVKLFLPRVEGVHLLMPFESRDNIHPLLI